ncbi:hypothetical protein MRX96_003693 [Rhipicephalus microplus]
MRARSSLPLLSKAAPKLRFAVQRTSFAAKKPSLLFRVGFCNERRRYGAEGDVRCLVSPLLRHFQAEVDRLGERSLAAEAAFLALYKRLLRAVSVAHSGGIPDRRWDAPDRHGQIDSPLPSWPFLAVDLGGTTLRGGHPPLHAFDARPASASSTSTLRLRKEPPLVRVIETRGAPSLGPSNRRGRRGDRSQWSIVGTLSSSSR